MGFKGIKAIALMNYFKWHGLKWCATNPGGEILYQNMSYGNG